MAPGNSPENVPIRMAELGVDKYDRTTDKYLTFNTKLGAHSAVWAFHGQEKWINPAMRQGTFGARLVAVWNNTPNSHNFPPISIFWELLEQNNANFRGILHAAAQNAARKRFQKDA